MKANTEQQRIVVFWSLYPLRVRVRRTDWELGSCGWGLTYLGSLALDFRLFRSNCWCRVSTLVGAEVNGFSVTVSSGCCGCFSGVKCRVGERTWDEPTPESWLVTLSRLCELIVGAVGNGVIGNGTVFSVSGLVKLFNFPNLCSRDR